MKSGLVYKYLTTTFFLFLSGVAFGQLSRPGHPYPLNYPGAKPLMINEIVIPADEKEKMHSGNENPLFKQAGQGFLIDVDYNIYNTGVWDTLSDGTKLWRIGFQVKDASAINVIFHPYHILKGVRVYIYTYDQQHVLGAFTDINNKSNGKLATSQLFTQLVIIEVQVPGYLSSAGELAIANIGCQLNATEELSLLKDGWFGASSECNQDINCYDNTVYQNLKHAVVRIVYGGGDRCTGTLINNTADNGRSYVLTAAHCISNETYAQTALFYFNYESPVCNGTDGSTAMSVSGSTIRAKGEMLDFVLLELLEPVPFYYHPVYAGWDVTGQPPASGFSIHHPLGDVKKISIEEHPLTVATFSSQFLEDSHWLVHHWESGTTEKGSSGGPFFDQYGRINGTLTGGLADCSNPYNDYYQMISKSWDENPDQSKQLKYWLDPLNQGPETTDAFDPYLEFWTTGDTLTNIGKGETLHIENDGLQWGSLSGHNSDHLTGFSEQFILNGNKKLIGVLLNVQKNDVGSSSAHMILKIWNGGRLPVSVLAEKDVLLADLVAGEVNFVQFDPEIHVSDTIYMGYQLFYKIPQDTFSLQMAQNRSEPVNSAYVYDGHHWISIADYTSGTIHTSFDISPVVYENTIPDTNPGFKDDVTVYPNPADKDLYISFKELTENPVQLQLYNLSGRLLYREDFPSYQTLIQLDTGQLTDGIYILRVTTGSINRTFKVIVVK